MNLWLFLGDTPTDGLEQAMIISDSQFLTDISDQPGDINEDILALVRYWFQSWN